MRDAFAVLFFVSVGMLFDPTILVDAPLALLATVLIIMVGKSVAAYTVVRLFGHSRSAALMITASLAQIGEFSFILANRSLQLGLLPAEGRDLILAGAIISILLNPLLFAVLDIYAARREKALAERGADQAAAEEAAPMREPIRPTSLKDHVVLVGHGRVGSFISAALKQRNVKLFVIEDNEDGVAALNGSAASRRSTGNAADPAVIQAANLPRSALPARGYPRRVRRRPGGAAGPRHQSRSADHRPGPFRGGDRPSPAARRQHSW